MPIVIEQMDDNAECDEEQEFGSGDHGEEDWFDSPFDQVDQLLRKWTTSEVQATA